ncbi:hypothetical protein HO133_003548 [Letharia lupina]|uniref:Uncharacterized protein n=1 Tax=Letharia lupina TaxID=560253 RepID=A0A8H6F9J7_9LECA|nr:uncharacterized protein HO133_003548 [Letharia lupina]KAF6219723.1 hypothetical protein HO133_003548 [Letharia lupina]
MDSWSRPTKHAATPPPLYLTPGGEAIPYCHTCGRIISTRKSQTTKAASTTVKYCSDRCRHNKPSQAPSSTDRRIQDTFIALLDGKDLSLFLSQDSNTVVSPNPSVLKGTKGVSKKVKGETRVTVSCAEIEALVFGVRHDPEKAYGRKKNRARRGAPEPKEWKPVDMEDKDDDAENPLTVNPVDATNSSYSSETESDISATGQVDMISLRVRPPQSKSEVNGSIGGEKGWAEKITETPEMLEKRLEGQKRAEERELVRCAARRLCAFGVVVDDLVGGEDGRDSGGKGKGKEKGKGKGHGKGKQSVGLLREDGDDGGGRQESRKKCEAVMSGNVVEASYAKGEWGIRWRE